MYYSLKQTAQQDAKLKKKRLKDQPMQ